MPVSRSLAISFTAIVVAIGLVLAASRSQAPATALARRTVADAAAEANRWLSTIRGSRLVAVMRQSSLDLRHVDASPGEQVIVNVFVTLGRARVRVPDGWAVNTSALPLMGSIDQARSLTGREPGVAPVAAPPRLILRGFVIIGKVEVTS